MVPNTDYPEKARSMADLIARLPLAPGRVEAALTGLAPAESEAQPIPGKWSIRQCVEHISLVGLGWTDMCYEAIEDHYHTPRAENREWRAPLEAQARQSLADALTVFRSNNATVARMLETLPPQEFARKFKPVSWLTEPFQINESVNWGLVIHPDYHLATLHHLRTAFGKPLAWMAVYWERYPKP